LVSEDREKMLEYRHVLGLTQQAAGLRLACGTQMVAHIEAGRRKLGPYRSIRVQEELEAFRTGGQEALDKLPAFARPPKHRTLGGYTIPANDFYEMGYWRGERGLTQEQAANVLFLTVHSIRAIEQGRMRISEATRSNMDLYDSSKGRGRR
jgi:DNA-binding XRE family transcriptional regulator